MTAKQVLTMNLSNHLETEFRAFLVKSVCEHNWQHYGHGFQCSKCMHYTGMNHDLNKLIKKENPTL